jgi:Tfp pilus assembly protein PilZ
VIVALLENGRNMPTKEKSRRYARVELPKGMLVAWEHYGIRKVSRVRVLALGGLFISTPKPPPVGDAIQLIFEVPGGDVRARAMIRDSQPGKGMGIEFTSMNSEARARLNQLMKVLSREVGARPAKENQSSPSRKEE